MKIRSSSAASSTVGLHQKSNGRIYLPLVLSCNHTTPLWRLPTGEVERKESGEEAAIRETKEETGLVVCNLYHVDTKEVASKDRRYDIHLKHIYVGEIMSLEGFLPTVVDGEDHLVCEIFLLEDVVTAIRNNGLLSGYRMMNTHADFFTEVMKKVFG